MMRCGLERCLARRSCCCFYYLGAWTEHGSEARFCFENVTCFLRPGHETVQIANSLIRESLERLLLPSCILRHHPQAVAFVQTSDQMLSFLMEEADISCLKNELMMVQLTRKRAAQGLALSCSSAELDPIRRS